VCTGYQSAGKPVTGMPALVSGISKIQPVYECLPGWRSTTFGLSSWQELPARAKDYLAFLESHIGVEVGCVSTGPERTQTIVRRGSRLDNLLS